MGSAAVVPREEGVPKAKAAVFDNDNDEDDRVSSSDEEHVGDGDGLSG